MRGFSLVELSIVLVILGLLTGGILAGQSLIHASELRAITSEYNRYSAAAYAFRDKYFALPGDMNNATAFWGKDNTNCSSDSGTAATNGTCNGNGDGNIDGASAAGATGEIFQYWKQLALAGLIEGNYTGLSGPISAVDPRFGTNSPASKFPGAGWSAGYFNNNISSPNNYAFNYNFINWFTLAAENDHAWGDGPVMKNEDAWNMDTKMDDGKPGTGGIMAMPIGNCTGSSDSTDHTVSYNLNNTTSTSCALLFKVFN